MNTVAVAAVGGVALLGLGALYWARSRPKAEETVPGTPPQVPAHPGVTEKKGEDRTSLCQVLTGYRQKLKQYQDLKLDAERRMRDLEAQAQAVCRTYAKKPVFQYHCNGFIICSLNEWYTVSGTETDQEALDSCMAFARYGAPLPPRAIEKRPGGAWDDTWPDIDRINAEIAAAFNQLQTLRKQYEEAKRQAEDAERMAMEMQRRIADMEAQGVFC